MCFSACARTQTKTTQTEQLAEKLNARHFRGALPTEESLFLWAFTPRGIPHFVRNDDRMTFLRKTVQSACFCFPAAPSKVFDSAKKSISTRTEFPCCSWMLNQTCPRLRPEFRPN